MAPLLGQVETMTHFRIETQPADIDHIAAIRRPVHAGIHPGDVLGPGMRGGGRQQVDGAGIIERNTVETCPVVARTDRNQGHGHLGRRNAGLRIQAVDDFVHGAVAAHDQQFPPAFLDGFPGQFDGVIGVVRDGSGERDVPGLEDTLDLRPVMTGFSAAGTAADDDSPV